MKSFNGKANKHDVEAVWDIIENHKAKTASSNNENKPADSNKRKNGDAEPEESVQEGEAPKKKKKSSKDAAVHLETNGNEHLSNGNAQAQEVSKKKNKSKTLLDLSSLLANENGTTATANGVIESTFSFTEAILDIVQSKKGSIPLKKLEKKVLNVYQKHSGAEEISQEVIENFHSKVKLLSSFRLEQDKVTLTDA